MGFQPCGFTVDMLRSCYSTKARYYEGDPTEDDLIWYFTDPDAPFLPVPSVINSLNWVDRRGLVDTGHAGEVVGAPRLYSKGQRNVAYSFAAYCGTSSDWLGHGLRPSDVPMTAFGIPSCCGGETLPVVPMQPLSFFSNFVFSGSGISPVAVLRTSSNYWFDWFAIGLNNGMLPLPIFIDLFSSFSGGLDVLTDFQLLDFGGYAQLTLTPQAVTAGPGPTDLQWIQSGNLFQNNGSPNGPHTFAQGIVISDGTGVVLFYLQFSASGFDLSVPGNYLQFDLTLQGTADYP